jgi:hypothetical protein
METDTIPLDSFEPPRIDSMPHTPAYEPSRSYIDPMNFSSSHDMVPTTTLTGAPRPHDLKFHYDGIGQGVKLSMNHSPAESANSGSHSFDNQPPITSASSQSNVFPSFHATYSPSLSRQYNGSWNVINGHGLTQYGESFNDPDNGIPRHVLRDVPSAVPMNKPRIDLSSTYLSSRVSRDSGYLLESDPIHSQSISPKDIALPLPVTTKDVNLADTNISRMEQFPDDRLSATELEISDDVSVKHIQDELRHILVRHADESEEAREQCRVSMKTTLNTAMNVVKDFILHPLLQYALVKVADAVSENTDAVQVSTPSGSDSHGSRSASSFPSSDLSASQASQRQKRKRDNRADPDDVDGSESDDDDRPKKRVGGGLPERAPQRRLKCPFYQRQPDMHTRAACRGEGFTDIAKLKDHIKRVHTQPLRCPRCWLEMKSDDANSEHIRQDERCEIRPEPQEDRIRPQLLKKLNFKKAPYSNARSVEEKWKMMFKILFPKDEIIPSPYDHQGINPRLEQILSEALEEELSRELAPILEPILSSIIERIPAIVKNCRMKLMDTPPSHKTSCTPPASLPGVGSSDSDLHSSNSLAKGQDKTPASQFSTSIDIPLDSNPTAEILSDETQGKRPQQTQQSTDDVYVNNLLGVSESDKSINDDIFDANASSDQLNCDGNITSYPFDEFDLNGFCYDMFLEPPSDPNLLTSWPESQMEEHGELQLEKHGGTASQMAAQLSDPT